MPQGWVSSWRLAWPSYISSLSVLRVRVCRFSSVSPMWNRCSSSTANKGTTCPPGHKQAKHQCADEDLYWWSMKLHPHWQSAHNTLHIFHFRTVDLQGSTWVKWFSEILSIKYLTCQLENLFIFLNSQPQNLFFFLFFVFKWPHGP